MTVVLDWIKSNIVTVVFLVVMIAALVGLPILAGRLNRDVSRDVQSRERLYTDLDKLTKTQVTLPGPDGGPPISTTLLVNPQFLRRSNEVTAAQRADAEEILALAEAHNRKGRGVLLDRLFPQPPAAEAEVLPMQFHRLVRGAHENLLQSINAGSPPSHEEMMELVQQRQAKFLTQTLQKDMDDPLDEQEQEQLKTELTDERMRSYVTATDTIRLYASLEALNLPEWNQSYLPTMTELFEWQWQYWIHEDVLNALADANRNSPSVLEAPLKRVLDVTVWPVEPAAAAAAPAAPDPSRETAVDYSVSFTGRRSNALYDVRHVQLSVIVDTNRLPQVLDALARQNFITVLDLTMRPADSFEAARDGYLYGREPVSEVVLQLETIWLRSWTSPFMPDELKAVLGIPISRPAPPA